MAADKGFDVQQNGSSIGTIRFVAGALTLTFVAAAAITPESGDGLVVVAPASTDASLADLATTMAGGITG